MMVTPVIFLLMSVTQCVWGYNHGAPDSACSSLTPNHDSAQTQTTPSPFRVSVNPTTYTPGGSSLTVTLDSPCGTPFKGYLLKVDYAELNRTTGSLGSFNAPIGSKSICAGNGTTHQDNASKQRLQFLWTPPQPSAGTIMFRATFVQSKSIFWVDVHSDPVYEAGKTTPPPASLVSPVRTTISPQGNGCPAETSFPKDPDCGKTKGCFSDCVGDSCGFLVTWVPSTNSVTITLQASVASSNRYIALGLSNDLNMGDDSVSECIYDGSTATVYNSYNSGKRNSNLGQEGLDLSSWSYTSQILTCEFVRVKEEGLSGKRFPLSGKSYILFLATGPSRNGDILEHDSIPAPTEAAVSLEDTTVDIFKAAITSRMVKAHGSLMMVAWIFAASVGIVMARYFKPMWPDNKLFGQKVWFQVHRGSMVLVQLCTVIAFIIIFVEAGEYSEISGEDYKKAHPVLGIIVTALCIINPVMALFRCHPGTKNRPIFNWAHWIVGFTAYTLAVITIFFGVKLEKAGAPEYIVYVLVAFVCWQTFVFLLGRMLQDNISYEMARIPLIAKPLGDKQEGVLAKNVLLAIHIAALTGFIITLLVILNNGSEKIKE
ncbi:putative ferric-chelate reductase 1 [Pomacea canaliculata]|uniref:putative ferric-chelate reductase 1 n=1 Tax=Pomacea canaliculata TaxID=400727 RepID=UPI000D730109|nr:putative ferric-chelate reductase 1 [Pomacea canaliculata]